MSIYGLHCSQSTIENINFNLWNMFSIAYAYIKTAKIRTSNFVLNLLKNLFYTKDQILPTSASSFLYNVNVLLHRQKGVPNENEYPSL